MSSNGIRSKPNFFYATLSVALVLFLLGFFSVLAIQANQLVQNYKEQINLIVEIENGATTTDMLSIEQFLAKQRYTKKASIQRISKKEALEMMRAALGEDLLAMEMVNPLYNVIQFNLNSSYLTPENIQSITQDLRAQDFVNDVYYREDLLDSVAANLSQMAWIAMVLGLLFLLVAISLIHNTVRLALYANRFLIKNMELVGASWEFISKPYLWRSLRSGFLSSLLAIGLLCLVLFFVQENFPSVHPWQDLPSLLIVFIGLMALGILIMSLSTYFIVYKYLAMRLDDLY